MQPKIHLKFRENRKLFPYQHLDSDKLRSRENGIVWYAVGDTCSSLVDVQGHPDFVPDEGRTDKH
jgi:hypothetical protein